MSSILEVPRSQSANATRWGKWVPIVFGLGLMYVPSYIHMWEYYWWREDNAHGPLIVAVVAWLVWRRRNVLLESPRDVRLLAGSFLIALGLLLYLVGRSQTFAQPDAF